MHTVTMQPAASTTDAADARVTSTEASSTDLTNPNPGTTAAPDNVERIHADHAVAKRLGTWTRAGRFEVRARRGVVVLDLRSPDLPAELDVNVELRRATVKLLVPDDASVEHWDLHWTARGRVKDPQQADSTVPAGDTANVGGARRIRLTGVSTDSEVRVQRGGIAILTAMCSREYLQDVRRAHRTGTQPTVDDPARAAR